MNVKFRRAYQYSPRARGWTDETHHPRLVLRVFPACAGMDRVRGYRGWGSCCIPRVRGDGPTYPRAASFLRSYSPRAREYGWSDGSIGVQPAARYAPPSEYYAARGRLPWFHHSGPRHLDSTASPMNAPVHVRVTRP
jgi:hypothetical protein